MNKHNLFVPAENGDGMSYSKYARGHGVGRSWPLTADPERSCDPEHSRRIRPSLSLRPLLRYGTEDQRARHWEVGPVDPSIPWPPHVGSFLSRSVGLLRLQAEAEIQQKPKAYSGTWGRYNVDGWKQ